MLDRAWADGVPFQWVADDSANGNAATLREAIATAGRYYVLEMPKPTRIRTATGAVEAFGQVLTPEAWIRYALTLNEQGLRESDWTAHRVVSMTDDLGEHRHKPALLTWLTSFLQVWL